MQDFAVKRYGFPAEYVRNYKQDPKVAKLLHDAFIGQQIIQKNTEKPKVITQAKPVPTVSAKGRAVKNHPLRCPQLSTGNGEARKGKVINQL